MAKHHKDRYKPHPKHHRHSTGNKFHSPLIIRHAPKPMRRLFSSRETTDLEYTEPEYYTSPTQNPSTTSSKSKASSKQKDDAGKPAELRAGKGRSTRDKDSSKALAKVSSLPVRKVIISVLLPHDPKWLFSWPRVREALSIGVDKVLNGASPLLRGVELVVDYRNSSCSIELGIKEAIDAYMENVVDVFFGPCCDYSAAPVGRQGLNNRDSYFFKFQNTYSHPSPIIPSTPYPKPSPIIPPAPYSHPSPIIPPAPYPKPSPITPPTPYPKPSPITSPAPYSHPSSITPPAPYSHPSPITLPPPTPTPLPSPLPPPTPTPLPSQMGEKTHAT
ncbi:hypothetical protein ACOMHN_049315 [Nucella lapillus]